MSQHQSPEGKYSPEVEEILHKRPSLLVRQGILFLAILVAMLLGASHFIKYPEQLATPVHFPGSHAGDTGVLHRELILNAAAASLVKPGQHVKMVIGPAAGETHLECSGKVVALYPVKGKDYYSVLVLPDTSTDLQGNEGTAYIYIGEESLLSKILNPVFAVFRPAGH